MRCGGSGQCREARRESVRRGPTPPTTNTQDGRRAPAAGMRRPLGHVAGSPQMSAATVPPRGPARRCRLAAPPDPPVWASARAERGGRAFRETRESAVDSAQAGRDQGTFPGQLRSDHPPHASCGRVSLAQRPPVPALGGGRWRRLGPSIPPRARPAPRTSSSRILVAASAASACRCASSARCSMSRCANKPMSTCGRAAASATQRHAMVVGRAKRAGERYL